MSMRAVRRRQRGQGMTEYIIIVALVAIAAIAVYSYFGKTVRDQMSSVTSQLAGGAGDAGLSDAKTTAGEAVTEAQTNHNLSNYNAGNKKIGQSGN